MLMKLDQAQTSKNRQKRKWLKIQGGSRPTRYTVKKTEDGKTRTLFIPALALRRIIFDGEAGESITNRGAGALFYEWVQKDPGSGWPQEHW